jgi:Lrp/AsnC family transcriptional regulator
MDRNVQLDALDRRILAIIQDDATLPLQTIGERVGLSSNPCWRRIRRLEAEGVIERRVALVDPMKLGLGLTAFVSIRTDKHSADWLKSFAKAVASIPEIVECHRMSGDIDYLLKIVVEDIAHYDRVYKRLVSLAEGLSDVSSAFSMERLKFRTAIDVSTIPE